MGGGGGEKARQHFCSLHEQFLLTGGRGAVELWCVRLCAVALLPLSGGELVGGGGGARRGTRGP